jgi:hypothetical protein
VKVTSRINRIQCLAAVAAAALALVACGDDGDEQSRPDEERQQVASQGAPDTAAAQRLETYLKKNTKQLKARHTATGEVISFVEASNGELKIWTFLNAEIPTERATAPKVCQVAMASGVPEANGALVVDGGDVELERC